MVTIIAVNGLLVSSLPPVRSYVYILCNADASSGTFTIPSAILNLLPANGYGTTTKAGVSLQIAGVPETHFTATGIDAGVLTVFTPNGSVATISQ
jgi:hypothetical protein